MNIHERVVKPPEPYRREWQDEEKTWKKRKEKFDEKVKKYRLEEQ